MTTRPRVAVIGGGISGLATAHTLQGLADVTVFESAPSFGGKLQTSLFRGHLIDIGADSFITRNDAAVRLCASLGLRERLCAPASNTAAVYAKSALRQFPNGLVIGIPTDVRAVYRSGIISRRALVRAFRDNLSLRPAVRADLHDAARRGRTDPSVAHVVGGRLGNEILDELVDPLIGGINASNVSLLSFAAALPQLVEQLHTRRSLSAALRPLVRVPGGPAKPNAANPPAFFGLSGGMATLIDGLVAACEQSGVSLVPSTDVRTLSVQSPESSSPGGWAVHTAAATEYADAVVVATPAFAAASLVDGTHHEFAGVLRSIPYAGVATVTAAWSRRAVEGEICRLEGADGEKADPLRCAGVLIPRHHGLHTSALSFTSTKWPQSANENELVIRLSIGRHGDERWKALSDDELTDVALRELRLVLGLRKAPSEVFVTRWFDAFPQYTVGHLERLEQIERYTRQLPAFALAGAAYGGIGIPACIESAQEAARRVAPRLVN